MSKKKDSYYFENFVTCVEYSSRAARMLEENLIHFRRENLKDRLDEIIGWSMMPIRKNMR